MKKFFEELKGFILKGNAVDLAVGLIVGTAFNAVMRSLAYDIIMPLVSLLFQKDVRNLFIVLRGSATYDDVTGNLILSENAVLLTYGNFIQSVLDLLIIGLSLFLTLKLIVGIKKRIDRLVKKEEASVELV